MKTVFQVVKNSTIVLETGIESRARIKAEEVNADLILKITTEIIKL